MVRRGVVSLILRGKIAGKMGGAKIAYRWSSIVVIRPERRFGRFNTYDRRHPLRLYGMYCRHRRITTVRWIPWWRVFVVVKALRSVNGA